MSAGRARTMPLTIAALQSPGTLGDVDANLRELAGFAEQAAGAGAQLLITPEMFVTGYDIHGSFARFRHLPLCDRVCAIAARFSIALIVGLPEFHCARCFNSAVVVDRDGTVMAWHRKSHLFGALDRGHFAQGDSLFALVDITGVRIATMICYEVEFPEVVRAAALAGAHLVAVPTAQMAPFDHVADGIVRARAWENQIYIAYVNHVGRERDLVYVGRSSIVSPGAQVLDYALSEHRLLMATIDPALVASAQKANPYLADRRVDLYRSAHHCANSRDP